MKYLTNKILGAGLLILFLFLAWFFSDIVAYLLIATVLWFILTPLVNFLDHTSVKGRSLPRWLATLLSMVAFITILFTIFSFFIPMAVDQAALLTEIDIQALLRELESPLRELEKLSAKYGISDNPKEQIETYLQDKMLNVFGQIGDVFGYLFGLTGNLLVGFFAVAFISFFFLKDEFLVKSIILGMVPDDATSKTQRVLSNAKRLLSRYFIGLIIQVTAIATLVTTGLSIFGIENALLIGLFAGFINVIPYIGPIFGMAFGMFVIFTTQLQSGIDAEMLYMLTKALAVFLTVQTLDNIVFQPVIFSNSVNAHPLEIFLIIFIAGKLGGIVGMICAIPGYTLIRIIAKEFLIQFKIVQNLTKNI